MAGIVIEKGKMIHTNGQPFSSLQLITGGQVTVSFPGGSYTLSKGDVIGICEICSEIYFLDYCAAEDTTLVNYSLTHLDGLYDLLRKYADVSRFFLLSAFRQFNLLLQHSLVSEMNCSSMYQSLTKDMADYQMLANRYRINRPLVLEQIEDLSAYLSDESADLWLGSYYQGFYQLYAGDDYKSLMSKIAVSVGTLRKCSLDFRKTYLSVDEQDQYRKQTLSYYFSESGADLFDHYYTMLCKLGADNADTQHILERMDQMIAIYRTNAATTCAHIEERIEVFHRMKEQYLNLQEQLEEQTNEGELPEELINSMNTILEYAQMSSDFLLSFKGNLQKYKRLADINGSDDSTYALRKALIPAFLELYEAVFKATLKDFAPPLPVMLFLYFGYIDEELAGTENCIYLYKLAQKLNKPSDTGVYTFYHWLLAIYNGQKEPSRNEFDQDYTEYIHKKKMKGHYTDAEINAMLKDPWERVAYELHNMFPSVNKMTFGRITTYCPFFAKDNVLKNLEDSLVTAAKIGNALDTIKRVDFSAYYRESLDYDNIEAMGKELIHLEFLPDIILMPNVGIHGVMWQEIEGKKRNSNGRMMYSIFHMEDVTTTMIHLTGEFRWEMCKRVQGARWNDISEISLTSEYFDYIQFYRKNHDLSAEVKDKVGIALKRAKNSFKEMFIRDYQIWILFEGNGAPRLNKVARRILFTHCPFPADIDNALSTNPLYSELLQRKKIKTATRLHHLEMLAKKLSSTRYGIPQTLKDEMVFVEFGNKM